MHAGQPPGHAPPARVRLGRARPGLRHTHVDLLGLAGLHSLQQSQGAQVRGQGEIRLLAWVIVDWARDVRPAVICMENVPEFVTWALSSRRRASPTRCGQARLSGHSLAASGGGLHGRVPRTQRRGLRRPDLPAASVSGRPPRQRAHRPPAHPRPQGACPGAPPRSASTGRSRCRLSSTAPPSRRGHPAPDRRGHQAPRARRRRPTSCASPTVGA